MPLFIGVLCGTTPLITMWCMEFAGTSRLTGFVIGYGLAGAPFIWLCRIFKTYPRHTPALVAALITAMISRLLMVGLEPMLSEDVWRYIWDGLVLIEGLNPYQAAPIDSYFDTFVAAHQLDWLRSQVGHGHVPTVYPPAAELTFALSAWLGPNPIPFRCLCIGADLACILILWNWLDLRSLPPQGALLYAFSPLSIVETSVGTHIEPIAVATLCLGLYCVSQGRRGLAAISLAWATALKIAPILMFFSLLRAHRRVLLWWMLLLIIGIGAFMLYFDDWPQGLKVFAQRWRANDGFFAVLYGLGSTIWPSGEGPLIVPSFLVQFVDVVVGHTPGGPHGTVWSNELVLALSKGICGILVGVAILWSALHRESPDRAWLVVMTILLLVSPVVHPWYLLWVLPFAILNLSGSTQPIACMVLAWSLTIWLAYWAKVSHATTGVWAENAWVKIVEYGVIYAVWLVTILRRKPDVIHPIELSQN
ncbi:MAG: glycosyltransferase 87 family protein [Myxococcota bacterium]|nr:glycosyltransferase 87 family protein [Myxococcota bacterium]